MKKIIFVIAALLMCEIASTQPRRGPQVEPQFLEDYRAAFLQWRKVEIWQLYRALDLVGVLAREKDDRRMGVDPFDRAGDPVARRVRQKGDCRFLIVRCGQAFPPRRTSRGLQDCTALAFRKCPQHASFAT